LISHHPHRGGPAPDPLHGRAEAPQTWLACCPPQNRSPI